MRAPLNSRVGSNTSVPKPKGKGRQESLDRVPLDIQEALMLEDLLFVLSVCLSMFSFVLFSLISSYLKGIEGTYITYHPDYSLEDDDPLQGIRFTVAPSLGS